MSSPEIIADTLHIYPPSPQLVPGALYWYEGNYLSFSVVLDSILQQIKTVSLKRPLHLSVHLTPFPVTRDQLENWKAFYCTEKTQHYTSEYILMKRQGYKFLWRCLFLLWLCLTGAYAFDQFHNLGEYPQMLGRETFFLLAWVFLWKPIEMIVFEPWSIKHQLKLIKKLEATPITLTVHENSI